MGGQKNEGEEDDGEEMDRIGTRLAVPVFLPSLMLSPAILDVTATHCNKVGTAVSISARRRVS